MSNKLEHSLEITIFNSRWLLAPFYLGLIVSILLLMVKFFQELWHMLAGILHMEEGDVVIGVLTLVDISLIGSLLLMIIFSGYEIFISKINVDDHEDKPDWMGKVDFSGLKLKVIGAIVAISAIDLLKTFMNIHEYPHDSSHILMWKVIIHLAFVISGVCFATMDRIAEGTAKH